MDHYEMVEKLREKANVSYEEAKAALEASDWDILDALVLLEGEGKVKDGDAPAPEFTTQEKKVEKAPVQENGFKDGMSKLWDLVKKLFQKGNANQFVISRKDKEAFSMPITVLVILTIALWPWSLIALVVGLVCGARYSFRGPDITDKMNVKVNVVMDKAAVLVQSEKKEDQEETEENKAE